MIDESKLKSKNNKIIYELKNYNGRVLYIGSDRRYNVCVDTLRQRQS